MKKEILTLIIGVLIGAVLTTGVFLILKGKDSKGKDGMPKGDRPDFSMDVNSIDGGKRRERPSDTNSVEAPKTEDTNTTT